LSDPVQGHALQCQNEDSPPFRRQVIPENRALLTELVHRETQANVPTRAALGIQLSAISQGLSNYQRRSVWTIENGLHWILDVTFREDDSRVRDRTAARNLAILRKIAINLMGRSRTPQISMRTRRKQAAWNDEYMLSLVAG
jgi:predicted transposase YbfD/YdcC